MPFNHKVNKIRHYYESFLGTNIIMSLVTTINITYKQILYICCVQIQTNIVYKDIRGHNSDNS
jgi:hypothetical protein